MPAYLLIRAFLGWIVSVYLILLQIILFVIELLRRGAKVNCTNARGDMPLHLSAMRGFVELARELRKWGAEPNVCNSNGHTPMEMAIHQGLGGAEDVVEMYNVFATFIIKEIEPSRYELRAF